MSGPKFVKYDAYPLVDGRSGNRWIVFEEDGSVDGEAIASFRSERDCDAFVVLKNEEDK
tara:strand:- start:262 stop:438 length:177 start_codon:yes stop_codon:yes gene_type:complete